jgi:hypothetical protein
MAATTAPTHPPSTTSGARSGARAQPGARCAALTKTEAKAALSTASHSGIPVGAHPAAAATRPLPTTTAHSATRGNAEGARRLSNGSGVEGFAGTPLRAEERWVGGVGRGGSTAARGSGRGARVAAETPVEVEAGRVTAFRSADRPFPQGRGAGRSLPRCRPSAAVLMVAGPRSMLGPEAPADHCGVRPMASTGPLHARRTRQRGRR